MTCAATSHRALCRLTIAVLLIIGITLESAPTAAEEAVVIDAVRQSKESWVWKEKATAIRAFELDLVRADIEILPSDDPAVELVMLTDHDSVYRPAVRLAISHSNGRYRIVDIYPARSANAGMIECLPPIDERGDFWRYPLALRVKLKVPRGMPVTVQTMAGTLIDRR
jgi:hypothetical protein